jgi:MoxR-like ATPase
MRALNLVGLDFLDPIVLAAVADERPLLLIGPHGSAKSELLNRLAAVLGLEHRHYNASLISFDDLLGYPVPDIAGSSIRYLRTPGDLWDAESVFLDEISRCRPETQNKLFSVVHERRVQGLALPKLRYRWAAMNPPCNEEGDDEAGSGYEGSLPLDIALADRFAYVVELPGLVDMSPEDRALLVRRGGAAADAGLRATLEPWIADVRAGVAGQGDADADWIARYVSELVTPLDEAGWPISGRRAVALAGTVASVRAASSALGHRASLPDCALQALRVALPQRARGAKIEASRLTAVHRLAARAAGEPGRSPWRRIRALRDPVERVAHALKHEGTCTDRGELSTLVTDAFASLTVPRQYLFARHVLPIVAQRDCLTVSALEAVSAPIAKLAQLCDRDDVTAALPRSRMPEWNALSARVVKLRGGSVADAQLANVLLQLFAVEQQRFDVEELLALDRAWAALFQSDGEAAREAA